MKTKFMTRIFSAQENGEDPILDQISADIDAAIENDGIETEEYNIDKLDDAQVEVHDKVNDEYTIVDLADDEYLMSAKEDKKFSDCPEGLCNSLEDIAQMSHGIKYQDFLGKEWTPEAIKKARGYVSILKRQLKDNDEIDEESSTYKSLMELMKSLDSKKSKQFSEIKSAEEFREYAHKVMKEAHGDEYSEETTNKVVDDLLADNPNADFGELIGRLTSGFGQKSFSHYPDEWFESKSNQDKYVLIISYNRLTDQYYSNIISVKELVNMPKNGTYDALGYRCDIYLDDNGFKETKYGTRYTISYVGEKNYLEKVKKEREDKFKQEMSKKFRRFSDTNPTPNQEGADYELRQWIIDHPGQAKYIAELGAKWGTDKILEGLDHDMGETKNECNLKNFSEESRKFFGNSVSSAIPAALDSKLQDIAQFYKVINYGDIMNFNYTPEKGRKINRLYQLAGALEEDGKHEDALKKANEIALIVKNKTNEFSDNLKNFSEAAQKLLLKK